MRSTITEETPLSFVSNRTPSHRSSSSSSAREDRESIHSFISSMSSDKEDQTLEEVLPMDTNTLESQPPDLGTLLSQKKRSESTSSSPILMPEFFSSSESISSTLPALDNDGSLSSLSDVEEDQLYESPTPSIKNLCHVCSNNCSIQTYCVPVVCKNGVCDVYNFCGAKCAENWTPKRVKIS